MTNVYIYNLSINLCFNHLHGKENTSKLFFLKQQEKNLRITFFIKTDFQLHPSYLA